MTRVFTGALGVWGVAGSVGPDPDDASGFVIAPRSGAELRVRYLASRGWTAVTRDLASGAEVELGCHAGLPGLLRRLREALAPEAPAGRLVIGVQRILDCDANAP